MITQPRRIAVINLKRRLQEQLGDQIGMRMGHGVREESDATKIFFVTTGYLVKLIAHHPAALASITHIIIDEVHERSLDSDLLCWLARQHLASCPDTRLVLMSATLHTTLYAKYFTDKTIMKRPPTSLSGTRARLPPPRVVCCYGCQGLTSLCVVVSLCVVCVGSGLAALSRGHSLRRIADRCAGPAAEDVVAVSRHCRPLCPTA